MTHRSRTQRLALLSASTALVTAGLLPSTAAFAAPASAAAAGAVATAPTPTPPPTQPSQDAVKTTDPPSGISAELPGKAQVRSGSIPLDGKTVAARVYGVETPDGATGFAVYDMPGDRLPLEDALKGFVDAYALMGNGTLTSENVRKTTVDGHPALDATLTGEDGAGSTVGSIRFISDDDHLVMALTYGPEEDEKDLNAKHKQLLDSLQVP
ncbi:hypothetical protein [Streptomyces virginiae]|uniref:hypothetical protein n=1 Tax=Streptomyces virginiae TaxID=1961 RepID=UPI00224D7AFA|nr:hypothetical protein [Streptomyces virginiae]MCX4959809.1 hypothetical protein [Streptomyces virginiae]MCX5178639.1 hypothetical protein [Streptomyces virginiae]